MIFLETLRERNEALFLFGVLNLAAALFFLALSAFSETQIMGANPWFKPTKFALSTWAYAWAMGWIVFYLRPGRDIQIFNWLVIFMLGFEVLYIAIQAGRGQLSHFNQSTPFYAGMYTLMAVAATAVSLATAYFALQFFRQELPELPVHYLWAIRIGLLLFVIFSLEGFVMGTKLAHTIGGPDGGAGLPFLNWSRTFGDPRVAHFIGMHALQVLPILSWYLLRDLKLTLLAGGLYALLAGYVLIQALQGHPFLKFIH